MGAFPDFGSNAKFHQFANDEVAMRVVTEGHGPDVVFIPGGDATAESYSQQFALLSDAFRCISYDPRGAGNTTSPPA